ncbi:hypothetical protein [Leisingera sp. S232]
MDFKKAFLIAILAGSSAIALMSQAWAEREVQRPAENAAAAKSL